MDRLKFYSLFLFISLFVVSACSPRDKKENKKEPEYTQAVQDKPTLVDVTLAKRKPFAYELVSNGTVSAFRKADLRFESTENIIRIFVKNGDRVNKGQKLAQLDRSKLEMDLDRSKDNLDKARLELQDILIGQGYTLSDTAAIPLNVMKIARVKSNYDQSLLNLRAAEYNLKQAVLYAPFDGIIANLFSKEYNRPVSSEPFCTVIDGGKPEVVFMVLENELSMIKLGDRVLVTPFSHEDKIIDGYVSEINPVIDKNGMVRVKALADNRKGTLFDGMNVKVRVQQKLDSYVVIPKTALVLRTNKKVVFTLKNNRAIWNYVKTGMENSEELAITDGISIGDTVIFNGNMNLAHEAPVIINGNR